MSESRKPPGGRQGPRKPRPNVQSNNEMDAPMREEEPMDPSREENDRAPLRGSQESTVSEAECYTLQCFYDAENDVFRAGFLEFPDVSFSDGSREHAIEGAEEKLHSQLAALRQSGHAVPAPIRRREVPSRIEMPISQSLYRRLETLRHQERVSMDQLVTEILTSAVERKPESGANRAPGGGGGGGKDRRNHQHQSGQGHRDRPHGGGGGHRGNRRGSSYNDTMQNRENFMEYVRNLEKRRR